MNQVERLTDAGHQVGIDVSDYQRAIDWARVAASGVKFAFVKATEGTAHTDKYAARNAARAAANGISVGFYHYAHPHDFIDPTAGLTPEDMWRHGRHGARHYMLTVAPIIENDAAVASSRLPHVLNVTFEDFTNNQIRHYIHGWVKGVMDHYGWRDPEQVEEEITVCTARWQAKRIVRCGVLDDYPLGLWLVDLPDGCRDADKHVDRVLEGWEPEHIDGWGDRLEAVQFSWYGRVPGVNGDCDLNVGYYAADRDPARALADSRALSEEARPVDGAEPEPFELPPLMPAQLMNRTVTVNTQGHTFLRGPTVAEADKRVAALIRGIERHIDEIDVKVTDLTRGIERQLDEIVGLIGAKR